MMMITLGSTFHRRYFRSSCKFHSKRLRYISHISADTNDVPSRKKLFDNLLKEKEFDLLIIGGGATGSGAALDAAARGLKVLCLEMEDFSSGTSSRSTKLLWGGSRYLVQAFVSLLNPDLRLLKNPRSTISRFIEDFRMVLNCHRERRFLLERQPHLTSWLPIAVPLTSWIVWPPPFGFPPAVLGALGLFPLFFKFYDSLSGFSCPPSHIMTSARAKRKFPQLSLADGSIKYCCVFYEGCHDDARTNLAIAQSAAREGATMLNYCQVVRLLRKSDTNTTSVGDAGIGKYDEKIVGATFRDNLTGQEHSVYAKSVLLCGGPFTDAIRKLENEKCVEAVRGASGIHIVLPSYYAPKGFGLVDMNTSDGRFLFFLPWQNHVLVGTTDKPCKPNMRPEPEEEEILWLLNEASKFLSPNLRLRRQDVLSAWSGIRPLAIDPHARNDAGSTSSASRDHVVSHHPESGIVFVSGGKWTTYREMAEDAIDKVIAVNPDLKSKTVKDCNTLDIDLVGLKGYSPHLAIRLIQEFKVSNSVAQHLVSTYGGRAEDVLKIDMKPFQFVDKGSVSSLLSGEFGSSIVSSSGPKLLHPDFPYLEAEVVFAARFDWAARAEDFIARRTRLAFLNKDAAIQVIPRVIELMGRELQWDVKTMHNELHSCLAFMRHFGGTKPVSRHTDDVISGSSSSSTVDARVSREELLEVFRKLNLAGREYLTEEQIPLVFELLSRPCKVEEIEDCIKFCRDKDAANQNNDKNGKTVTVIRFPYLLDWWTRTTTTTTAPLLDEGRVTITEERERHRVRTESVEGGGTFFG